MRLRLHPSNQKLFEEQLAEIFRRKRCWSVTENILEKLIPCPDKLRARGNPSVCSIGL